MVTKAVYCIAVDNPHTMRFVGFLLYPIIVDDNKVYKYLTIQADLALRRRAKQLGYVPYGKMFRAEYHVKQHILRDLMSSINNQMAKDEIGQ